MLQAGVRSWLSSIRMPCRSEETGIAERALIVATTMPVLARASRETRSTCASEMWPSLVLLRNVCPAGIEAPIVAGTTQRMCGPPGPLNEPRSITSHGPEPTRRYGVTYGLLLLSAIPNVCTISWVIVPELSPCRMLALPHSCDPARHVVQGTYRVGVQFGRFGSGGPHESGTSSRVWNFISPNSCHTEVSSYPA